MRKANLLLLQSHKEYHEEKRLYKGKYLGQYPHILFALYAVLLLQILYGLADLFVTGRYCNVASITSVSNGAQVMYMFTVVIIGLAMGTTVLVARSVGANDQRRIAQTIGNTVTMFLVLAVVLSGILLMLRYHIVKVIDTPQEAVQGTIDYLTICFSGIPFIVAYNVIASIFRGLGDTRSPTYFVGIACVINIGLDFLFIGYFDLGPSGAALATVISQMISVTTALIAIARHRSVLGVQRHDLKPDRKVISDILKIGIPVAMQDGFIQVAFIAITVIANGRGLADAAAVGIVEKFIGLLFVVNSAMLSTVSTLSAQSLGAGRMARAQATMRYAMAISVGFGSICAIILQFVPDMAVRFLRMIQKSSCREVNTYVDMYGTACLPVYIFVSAAFSQPVAFPLFLSAIIFCQSSSQEYLFHGLHQRCFQIRCIPWDSLHQPAPCSPLSFVSSSTNG